MDNNVIARNEVRETKQSHTKRTASLRLLRFARNDDKQRLTTDN